MFSSILSHSSYHEDANNQKTTAKETGILGDFLVVSEDLFVFVGDFFAPLTAGLVLGFVSVSAFLALGVVGFFFFPANALSDSRSIPLKVAIRLRRFFFSSSSTIWSTSSSVETPVKNRGIYHKIVWERILYLQLTF